MQGGNFRARDHRLTLKPAHSLRLQKSLPRTLAIRALLAMAMALAVLAVTAPWWLPRLGAWTSGGLAPAAGEADAIVILAGDNGRLEEGVRLFHAGFGRELWHTGTDARVIEQAIQMGVPRNDVRLLRSNSTWEDAEQISIAARERGAKRLVIVTSWYHGRRALRALEKRSALTGATFSAHLVAPLGDDQRNWWKSASGRNVVKSEILKSLYYLVRYGVSLG